MKPTTVDTPLTVEEALKELREMFPVKVERNDYGSNKTPRSIYVERHEYALSSNGLPNVRTEAKVHIEYASGGYSASLVITALTLTDCMAQVRTWHAEQKGSEQ